MVTPEFLKILVVDDQAVVQKIVYRLLKNIGIGSITQAVDGLEAAQLLATEKFDAVVCDRHMEGMDGIDLFKTMSTLPQSQQAPFIMLTGDDSEKAIKEARNAGIRWFLKKPCSSASLKRALEKSLGTFSEPFQSA